MLGTFSIWHWLILAAVVAVFFGGKGKLSGIMGDAAKGIRAFKDGLKGEDDTAPRPADPNAKIASLPAEPAARTERDAPIPRAEL